MHSESNHSIILFWSVLLLIDSFIPACSVVSERSVHTQRYFVVAQKEYSLTDRVTSIEEANYQGQITSLSKYIASEIKKVRDEIESTDSLLRKYVREEVDYLIGQDTGIFREIDVIREDVVSLNTTVEIMEGMSKNLPGLVKKVSHLESVNKKWRQNFIVINKTFDQLRKNKVVG